MTRTILVSGASGRIGRRVAAALNGMGADVRSGSRSAPHAGSTRFDWQEPATFTAFRGIESMLVIAPRGAEDPLSVMRPGLESAVQAGVRRFVLVGASSIERDGPLTGGVYRWLSRHAREWTVLRPSWFMQNFSDGQHLPTICEERAIYSATGMGRVPFIHADDIANVAAVALTTHEHLSGELLLTGPEALSYDDVAARLTDVIGQSVRHHALGKAEMAERFTKAGLSASFAETLATMDAAIAAGAEDRVTDIVQRTIHQSPVSFDTFARSNASVWR